MHTAAGIFVAIGLLAIAPQSLAREPIRNMEDAPELLSQWHLFERRGTRIAVTRGVVPYDLNTPLFSDYAHKWRTISVPQGTTLEAANGSFVFPNGTIISKTFYYPAGGNGSANSERIAVLKTLEQSTGDVLDLRGIRLIETRLLVNTAEGWIALPYVWNQEQTDATLELTGELVMLELVEGREREPFTYTVPDVNQCASCHGSGADSIRIEPIGVKPRHLDTEFGYARGRENQLVHWRKAGLLEGYAQSAPAIRTARWSDERAELDARARAYLDVNCGHCHSATGSANTSGLFLDLTERDPVRLGLCKIPVATGRGSGTDSFDIVPGKPNESILLHRMRSIEPDVAMPELGRALVHREGVALVEQWIASLAGECDLQGQLRD